MIKHFIDNYTRAKVQKISTGMFKVYKPYMFAYVLENPVEQKWWDEYLNKRLKVSNEEYLKALAIAKQNTWFNNYQQVQIPEVSTFVDIKLGGTIRRLRELNILN